MSPFIILICIALGTAFVAFFAPNVSLRAALIATTIVTVIAGGIIIPVNIQLDKSLARGAELLKSPDSKVTISSGELKVSTKETTNFSGETIPFVQEYTILNPLKLRDHGFEVSMSQTPNNVPAIYQSLTVLSTNSFIAIAICLGTTVWLCIALWRFGKSQEEYVPVGIFVAMGLIFTIAFSGIPNTASFLALSNLDNVTYERVNNDLVAKVKNEVTISYQGREIIQYNQVRRATVSVNTAQRTVRSNPNGSLALALR